MTPLDSTIAGWAFNHWGMEFKIENDDRGVHYFFAHLVTDGIYFCCSKTPDANYSLLGDKMSKMKIYDAFETPQQETHDPQSENIQNALQLIEMFL